MQGGRIFRVLGICVALGVFLVYAPVFRTQEPVYGVTFSSVYAESLGLSADEVLRATVGDLAPAFVRLPVYWNRVAPQDGVYDWHELDAQIAYLASHNIPVHLVVGAKVPRWPECFIPAWVDVANSEAYRAALLAHVQETVTRYAERVAVWQVENEPTFPFGTCPRPDLVLLSEEVTLVREYDPNAQIQMTVSGEQQMWTSFVTLSDRVGVSLYRTVSHVALGSFSPPLSPAWYTFMRATVAGTRDVVISELQLEPWFTADPRTLSLDVAASLFTVGDAERTLDFARATRIPEIGMWGVEWWYYLRVHGHEELWNYFADR